MIDPVAYRRAAREAANHLQLSLDRIDLPATALGEARVVGKVQRVFRGSSELRGLTIALDVSCIAPGGEPPPGGALWTPIAELRVGRVLEAYVDPAAEGYAIAMWQSRVFDGVTDVPVMTVHEEDFEDAPSSQRRFARASLWSMGIMLVVLLCLVLASSRGCL
jgi:hypothetical protein